jgi:hypothetical protein
MADIIGELQRINDFEKRLTRVKLTQNTDFNVNVNRKFNFIFEGKSYSSKLNRPIIHQMGSRIWRDKVDDYKSVQSKWENEYSKNNSRLAERITGKLKESSLTMLLDENAKKLYGIISDNFVQIDPIEFRNKFVEVYQDAGYPRKRDDQYERTPYGEIVENFSFDHPSLKNNREKIDYNLDIIYGLNNGYSSFRVRLGRIIVICTNGLKAFEGITTRLKHIKKADVSAFVEDVKSNILEYDKRFQEAIAQAKNRSTQPSQLDELYQRLHVSTVVKNRIRERLEAEKKDYGNSEWALSQAFTNLGTHFYKYYSDRYHQRILTEVGSDILDSSVESVLDQFVRHDNFRELQTFRNFLPKEFLYIK